MNKKVYTKTGDQGKTALISGERLPKNSLVFEVLGTLDEFNASLGLVLLHFENLFAKKSDHSNLNWLQITKEKQFLLSLQNELFKLGAEIAASPKVKLEDDFVSKLEKQIDFLQNDLGANWRYKFVLPGGSEISAFLDLSRTVCRRLERRLVSLDNERDIRQVTLQFVNRTSDYLYTLRTWVNEELKVEEVEFKV